MSSVASEQPSVGDEPQSEASSDEPRRQPRFLPAPRYGEYDKTTDDEDPDIRGALEAAFWTSERVFEGTFCSQTSSSDAPDPKLFLDGFGAVTLPLKPAEAKAIVSCCKKAMLATGKNIVDPNVRNIWELDASAVHVENAEWEEYLKEEAEKMCWDLGMTFENSQPRCELYKLLVFETGSCFPPQRDSAKVDGMFASMVVVLPSKFFGGAVHLSRGERSAVLDPGYSSAAYTSILGWLTHITREIKPVTSGYQFALSYNLINTVQIPRFLFTPSSLLEMFRNSLVRWKEREDATPFKIVYLLGHQYSRANLRGSALKGSDAQVVALLSGLGKELGFCLALATVEYYVDDDPYDGYTESSLTIRTPVDLDGNPLGHLQEIDHDQSELIPIMMGGNIGGGVLYKEMDGYTETGGEHTERWYRRTVLLFWPELHGVELECGADFSSIFKTLKEMESTMPSKDDRRAADYLVRAAVGDRVPHRETVQSVCHAAACWRDLDLWRRIVFVCQGDQGWGYLTELEVSEAVRQLGFENTQATIEEILGNEKDNRVRFDILEGLERCQTTGQVKDMPSAWIHDQWRIATGSLKKPRSLEELSLFFDIFRRNQADPLTRAKIVSQLQHLADPDFLLHFACLLCVEKPTFETWDDGNIAFDSMVRDIIYFAISTADLFEARLPLHHDRSSYYYVPLFGPEFSHLCLLGCLKTGNNDLGGIVIERLLNTVKIERATSYTGGRPTELSILVPLMLLLANTIRAYPGLSSVPGIEKLYLAAAQVPPKDDRVLGIAIAIWLSGDMQLIKTVKSALEGLNPPMQEEMKTTLESMLGSILQPSQEALRPILEQFLEALEASSF